MEKPTDLQNIDTNKAYHDLNKIEQTDKQEKLLTLTWPIFIDLLLHFATLVINMAMVGAVSVSAVAELTVGNQVFDLCMIIFNFINIGICVVCAQALGVGNLKLLRRLVHQGLGINIIVGSIVSVSIFLLSPIIVDLMNVPENIADSSRNYLKILALCFLPEAIVLVCAAILRAYACTRDAMYVSLIINLITVFFNSLFLFGYFGMPILGVEGVAWSTVIGRTVAVFILVPLVIKRTKIKIIPKFLFVFKKKIFAAVLNIGLPGAGENLAWHGQYMFMTAVVGTFGYVALATHGIYFQMCLIMMIFSISIAMGTEILIARYVGALKLDLAYRQLIRSVKIGMIVTILLTFSMPLGTGEFIISLFRDDPSIIAMATPIFLLTVIMEPGRILNIIIINSLRATGDTRFPLIMAVISMWGISVPLGCFLSIYMNMGLLGVWIGFCVDEWVRGISMFIRWKSCKWKESAKRIHKLHLNNHSA